MAAHGLQELFYNIDFDERLSALTKIDSWRMVALPIGGVVLVAGVLAVGAAAGAARRSTRSRPTPCAAGGCRCATACWSPPRP